jgi:NitT/TauT family transport system substrate-binding protein
MSVYRLNAIIIVLLISVGVGCGLNPDSIPLRVGVNSWVGYDPFVVAKESGDLEKQGWRLVESASNIDSARGLRNGTLDAAALTLDEALNLIEEGAEISIVLALSVSKGADVVLARPGWDKESLRSVTSIIAFENTTLSKLVLTRFIEGLELDNESLQTQVVTAENHEKAFLSKEIDLILTFEPIASRIEKLGAKRVFDVLVVNNEALQNDLERVSQLILCWELGLRRIFIRDPEALKWLSQGGELEVEEYMAILEKLHFFNLDASISILKEDELLLADIVKKIGEATGAANGNWTPEFFRSSIEVGPLLNAIQNNKSIYNKD